MGLYGLKYLYGIHTWSELQTLVSYEYLRSYGTGCIEIGVQLRFMALCFMWPADPNQFITASIWRAGGQVDRDKTKTCSIMEHGWIGPA